MSNDISYIVKVIDEFSAPLKKFQAEIAKANTLTGNFSAQLKNTKIHSQEAATQGINAYASSLNNANIATANAAQSGRFFTQNLKDLAKAAGIYMGIQGTIGFGKQIFDTRIQMDSLNASLTAIMPKFDQTKSGAQLAAEEIEYLKSVTEKFGLSFKDALPNYMQFLASSTQDLKTTRKTFEAFAGISRMYGLSAQRFGLVINALNQMQSKGTISMEELRQQLGDSLPGALKLFSDAAGMSTSQFMKLVGNGQVGAGLIKNVAEVIEKKYGKDMVAASRTLGAETERLGNNFVYFKDTLSKQLEPAMRSTVAGLSSFTQEASSLFAAIKNDQAFGKLTEDGQAFVTILRVSIGLIEGLGKALSGVKILGGAVWEGLKDVVKAGTIGAYAIAGGDKEVARGAFQELGGQMMNRYSDNNQIELQINHNNAPRGTTTELRSKTNSNLKVGNMVNYETGGLD